MKSSLLFKQYVWLLDTIVHAGRISLREINDRWLLWSFVFAVVMLTFLVVLLIAMPQ